MEKPDVVVGTPSRVLAQLQAQTLLLRDSLEVLVLDEADLLFSFGFRDDLHALLGSVSGTVLGGGSRGHGQGACPSRLPFQNIAPCFAQHPPLLSFPSFLCDLGFSSSHLPKIYQSFLMSATFNEDVQALKELVLHNPVSVRAGIRARQEGLCCHEGGFGGPVNSC